MSLYRLPKHPNRIDLLSNRTLSFLNAMIHLVQRVQSLYSTQEDRSALSRTGPRAGQSRVGPGHFKLQPPEPEEEVEAEAVYFGIASPTTMTSIDAIHVNGAPELQARASALQELQPLKPEGGINVRHAICRFCRVLRGF